MLIGFTLRGGATLASGDAAHEESGGGVWCESSNATLANCVVSGNTAYYAGGGAAQGTLQYCAVSQNTVYGGTSYGGGAYDSALANCMIVSNSIYCAVQAFGGGVYECGVTNSAIADNSANSTEDTSQGGGAYMGNLDNCNITGNIAADGGGIYGANLVNCIDYFNTLNTNAISYNEPYTSNYWGGGTITYSCTAPYPSSYAGDITNDPQLASFSHISLSSPCRGAGTASASSGVDIDSNSWGNPPSMGCFEPHPGSVLGSLSVGILTPSTNWAPGFGLNFEANISGPVDSNLWNFGDGTFVTNEAYVSHTWPAAGAYPVTLTAYNDSYPAGVATTLVVNVAVPSTYYVNLNSRNPIAPYITWGTAAISIQDAVNVAVPGSVVLVTNGPTIPSPLNGNYTNSAAVYQSLGSRAPNGSIFCLLVTNPVTVESVSGPASTYILGSSAGTAMGCVYVGDGVTLNGFTLTNGLASNGGGAGISAASTNAFVTNCVVTGCGNPATYLGTFWNCRLEHSSEFGADMSVLNNCLIDHNSGGAEMSVLNNCTLTENSDAEEACLLNNCVISSNTASIESGAYGGTLNNCLIVGNTGDAVYADEYDLLVLNNCIISNNAAGSGEVVYSQYLMYPTNCFMTNCIVTHNSGGGVYGATMNSCTLIGNTRTGAFDSILNQCTLLQNSAPSVGAAQYSTLNDCLIISNSATLNVAGGVYECTLTNCIVAYNTAPSLGGGADSSTLVNCTVTSNSANQAGGGVSGCSLTNCILAYKTASAWGGGAYQSKLVNCTVTSNSAPTGGGVYESKADNSILYYNSGGDFYPNSTAYPLNYCCASLPTTSGIRNITNAPLFVNAAANDFHLQANSPCINSGNNAYITTAATDLDGNPRIAGGTVDIGAYEYQTPTSVISYAYLQQYGLPADGSVDFKDLDGTAFNVYQDWVAGLNPTNSASVLAMLTPYVTTNVTGVTVSWQSVSGILYNLQRSTNLASDPSFAIVQTNITGQAGTTTYTDSSATSGGPYFYRVNVVAP